MTREPLDLRGINFEEGYIAVLDKPLRWTSTDVVRKVKFTLRKLGYRKIKVGHAGTLDPLATGILVVCIGRATKLVDALQAEEKEYPCHLSGCQGSKNQRWRGHCPARPLMSNCETTGFTGASAPSTCGRRHDTDDP